MAATAAATTEGVAQSITEGIHAKALLEQPGPLMTAAESRPKPMKIEARPGGRWYRARMREDGSTKLYRTNAELSRVKDRAEAKWRRQIRKKEEES